MLKLVSIGVIAAAGLAAGAFAIAQPAVHSSAAIEASDLGAKPFNLAKPRIFLSEAARQDAARTGLLPPDTRSVLNLPTRLRYGSWVWDDSGVPQGTLTIYVDLRRQLISAFRGRHEIGTAVILYGTDTFGTPLGRFNVMAKMKDHRSSSYDAAMPYTLRLTNDGVSIHGSEVRGSRATHGCVGVPLDFARRLFSEAKVGTSVQIVKSVSPELSYISS
uniref:L,D-transpeptidase family protein n=1 Tax=Altererythrobacter segetis TaxID=1104773 RepID=UPI0014092A8D|nr:L,D-transpeptidase family protein [Altererythrobacter segetis]